MTRLSRAMALSLAVTTPVLAAVDLSLQPVVNPVFVGSQVQIQLIATNTNPGVQLVSAMDVIINWDPAVLQFTGMISNAGAPYAWFVNGFLNDPDGINAPVGPMTDNDGDALYTALAQAGPGNGAPVPDGAGLLVTTFLFNSLVATGGTPVDIVLSQGTFAETQVFDGTQGNVNILGAFSGTVIGAGYPIVDQNPPADNPYVAGSQPFTDVLDTGTTALLTRGIGAAGTPNEGPYMYAPFSVTFGGVPVPTPAPGNVTVTCTGGPCPTVASVVGAGAGPYLITLTAPIPPLHCSTINFTGTPAEIQYRSHPGDAGHNGLTNTQDLLAIVQALNNGDGAMAANLARYDMNRSGVANTQDLLRLVQLLNGTLSPQVFNGTTAAACP